MKKMLNVLFVTIPDAYCYLDNGNICVKQEDDVLLRVPLLNLEQIFLFNYFGATPQLLCECASRKISVSFLNEYGKYLGTFHGESNGNVLLRREQYRIADNERALDYVKNFIFGKLHNQKWVVERGIRDYELRLDTEQLKKKSEFITVQMKQVLELENVEQIRAAEGNAAHYYFSVFGELILQNKVFFTFKNRNRRPPTDPVNAIMSFAYTLLASECRHALEAVGLDSYVGFCIQTGREEHLLHLTLWKNFARTLLIGLYYL